MGFKATAAETARANVRALAVQRAGTDCFIEGGYYTPTQIAERLGVVRQTANDRLRRVRKMDGPVTWAKLGETK